jgi:hypothetical protein
MHEVDAVFEDLGWASERRGCSRLVLGNLNRGKHRAIHALERDEVTARIGYGYVHLPIPLLRFRHGGLNNRLSSVE